MSAEARKKLNEAIFTLGGLLGVILVLNPPFSSWSRLVTSSEFVVFIGSSVLGYAGLTFDKKEDFWLRSWRIIQAYSFSGLLFSTMGFSFTEYFGNKPNAIGGLAITLILIFGFVFGTYLTFLLTEPIQQKPKSSIAT